MENGRIETRFIDDKDIKNKVLILTLDFLLLGNKAAAFVRSFHYVGHNGLGGIVR